MVENMSRVVLLAVAYLGLSINISAQVPQSAPFTIHVTKIQRVNGGCTVDAESTTIRFKLRSSVPAACAMLRSGESYEAFRAITRTDPKDETKDASSLVITNNVKNSRKPNAVFAIDSEESIPQKLETGWTRAPAYLVWNYGERRAARDSLTLSQRGFASSVHTSSLRREKCKQVDRLIGNVAQSVNPWICKF